VCVCVFAFSDIIDYDRLAENALLFRFRVYSNHYKFGAHHSNIVLLVCVFITAVPVTILG
jgi:hypothetical protein